MSTKDWDDFFCSIVALKERTDMYDWAVEFIRIHAGDDSANKYCVELDKLKKSSAAQIMGHMFPQTSDPVDMAPKFTSPHGQDPNAPIASPPPQPIVTLVDK